MIIAKLRYNLYTVIHRIKVVKFFNYIFDILFREYCLGCNKSGVAVCVECVLRAEPAVEPNDMETWSAFAFHDKVIRKSIQALKYRRKGHIAEPLGIALYDRALELLGEKRLLWGLGPEERLIIIPVPLSDKRHRERGYNQAELIAESFVKEDSCMSFMLHTDVLYKVRETASQVSVKDRAKRLNNIRGAFEVKDNAPILDKYVVLLDDVTTTGATIAECKKRLLKAGAKEVFAITLAH